MRKKIFGMLLMGVLFGSSMSTLVSCKDYDDDINANVLAIDNLSKDLQTQVDKLNAAIAAAEQAAADAHATYVTKSELSAKAQELAQANQDNAAALQAFINANQQELAALKEDIAASAKLSDLESVKSDLEAAIKAATENLVSADELAEKLKGISSRIDAIDESLNTLTKDIEGLKEWKTTVEGQISSILADMESQKKAIADLQEAVKAKLEKGDLAGLASESYVKEAIENYVKDALAAYVESSGLDKALGDYAKTQEVMAAIEKALQNYTTTAELEALLGNYATEAGVTATLAATLKDYYTVTQIDAQIANINKAIADAKTALETKIGEVDAAVKKLEEDAITEEEVKAIAQGVADEVADVLGDEISNLNIFINRVLKSISLVPQLFVGGIEAIEFSSLQYTAIQPGTSGLNKASEKDWRSNYLTGSSNTVIIDNGAAEAYYRLNPSIVERESIDESNIEFLAATAATRAATVTSPVEFNGIADKGWNYGGQKGLIKVNLKKTAAFANKSLNDAGDGLKYIVALKVPRKADADKGVEAADIVSENSLLVETVKTPRIARLPWNLTETKSAKGGNKNVHHYTDSVTMWDQNIDADQLVYAKVNYNEPFDVLAVVTGCDNTCNQLTKDLLKSYGLTFRFHVAGTLPTGKAVYNDVDHDTDQQQFAAIADEARGLVTSKLPNGVVDNRACVGKEPIITIQLVDTVHNKLVDERYMKIKWIEKTMEPKDLGEFTDTTTLNPCKTTISAGIRWKEVIERIYAKVGDTGMSQSTFEQVYLGNKLANVNVGNVTMKWENGNPATNLNLLSNASAPAKPEIENTTNKFGDAVIAIWEMEPQEIANIYPHQSKTFSAVITFKSILPTEYPDLTLTYSWTITLPTLPAINGYYDNYWLDPAPNGEYTKHDVMPVQYNTALYQQIIKGQVVPQGGTLETYNNGAAKYASWTNHNGDEGGYCVYYNNLMNVFTYDQTGRKFIVKDLGKDCGTWDMQFTRRGADAIAGSTGKYGVTYTQFGTTYGPRLGTNVLSPSLEKVRWEDAKGYRLYDKESAATGFKQALQLVWDEGHAEWCGVEAHKQAILYADHNNEANWPLINPLDPEKNEADGRTPLRTHVNPVHMGIWGTLNDWNIVHVKDYDIYLVAPIRVNAKLDGAFEEGWVSGTAINCDNAFTMTDFRGYEVAKVNPTSGLNEWNRYRAELYKYYEVGEPVWKLKEVKYGFKKNGGNVVADKTVYNTNKEAYTAAMTSDDLKALTNGNIDLSIDMVGNELVFKNNGGSNVEDEVDIYIPVSVTYGFGKITEYVKARLYPRGKVPAGVTIKPAA